VFLLGFTRPQGFPGYSGPTGLPGATKNCPCRERSAFFAKLSGSLPSPSKPVIFTEIGYNDQRDLKKDTGIFTCKIPGNYHFSFDVQLHHCKVKIELMRNQTQVLEKHQLSRTEYENISSATIMVLSKGDNKWLEAEVETKETSQAEVMIYFSGFLTLF
jgi:hypothetical protein